MGVAENDELRLGFGSRLKLGFCGSKVTSDTGLLAYRELDEALKLTQMGEEVLTDSRLGANKRHLLVPLLRQSIYSHFAGYEDVKDAERLCYDPAMLRRGNNASAKFWRRVLLPVIERYRHLEIPKFFRGDAAFALPKLLRVLEDEGCQHAIRIKANAVLERAIEHLLTRPVRRPSHKPKVFYHRFRYRKRGVGFQPARVKGFNA